MKLLENKVALITGASRGIGNAIARTFAEAGANIAFTYLSSDEKAKKLEDELSSLGVKVKAYKSNAASFEEAQELSKNVHKEFGAIDILVNNAGVTRDNLLLRMNEKEWDASHSGSLQSGQSMANLLETSSKTLLQ